MATQCIGQSSTLYAFSRKPLPLCSTHLATCKVPSAPFAPLALQVPKSAGTSTSVGQRRGVLRVRSSAEEASSASPSNSTAPEVLTQEQVSEAKASSDPAAATTPGLPAYRHILLPVMDRNPHLNEATRGALEFGTALARANASDITVVVIDEDEKEDITDHKQRLDSIRFYLNQGGFAEFKLLERLGEGKMPAAVVGEVADDLELDLVVLSMEAVHHKHIDCNLLAEFTPCPVMLLPL